jgi:hypothetical protein
MINDIQAVILSKLTVIDREVRELQQACVLYGIKDSKIAHRLQHVNEVIEDARA